MYIFHRLRADKRGAVALEFAILAPLYLFMIFGTLEIGFALSFNFMLNHAAERAGEYLMTSRQNYTPITEAGLRSKICSSLETLPISCSGAKLKISFINADNPATNFVAPTYPVENRFDAPSGGQYIVAIGYYWGFIFPTTVYALPFSGPSAQIQSINFVVLSERVTDG